MQADCSITVLYRSMFPYAKVFEQGTLWNHPDIFKSWMYKYKKWGNKLAIVDTSLYCLINISNEKHKHVHVKWIKINEFP